eukprot:5335561-Amphidinium_carterae.2
MPGVPSIANLENPTPPQWNQLNRSERSECADVECRSATPDAVCSGCASTNDYSHASALAAHPDA